MYGIAAKELSRWYRRQAVELRAVRRLGVAVPALDDASIARIEARYLAGCAVLAGGAPADDPDSVVLELFVRE